MGAIEEILPAVGHFFCAWHRRKNIIKQCGGSSGRVPYSALWVYNKLIECRSVEHFNKLRNQYFPLMDHRDLQYLNNIDDHAQYPVKRCDSLLGRFELAGNCTMPSAASAHGMGTMPLVGIIQRIGRNQQNR
jgi:hypothetical protein